MEPYGPDPVADARLFYGTRDPATDLCFFGASLRFHQYREDAPPPANRPGDGPFPDGYFHGALGALALTDPAVPSAALAGPDPFSPARPDLRAKAVWSFADQAEFEAALLPAGTDRLDDRTGVALIRGGGLDLSGRAGGITFGRSAMILVDGPIRLPRVTKSPEARAAGATLVLVALAGPITAAGDRIEAGLVALGEGGTLRRETDQLTVKGAVAIDTLDFMPTGPGLFAGRTSPATGQVPTGERGLTGYPRVAIEYDPDLDPAAAAGYRAHYRTFAAGGLSFWAVTE